MKNDLPERIAGNQVAAQAGELPTCVESLQGLIRDLPSRTKNWLSAERSNAKNGERLVPVSEDEAIKPQPAVDLEVTRNSALRPRRVFVVDDEISVARTLAEILLRHGYCATWFTSPREGIAHIVDSFHC
jgi:hypothetical protein